MILEHGNVKRAGVYLFFDKQGHADDYIIEMIKDLKKSIDMLLVVCNGYVEAESLLKLQGAADEVICRANTGFDLGAYRDGILYLGYRELQKYDETVFINYTFFGPIGSFSRVFNAMENLDVSFWGLTKHHRVDPDPFGEISYGFLPEHIQSHFIAVRRNLLMSYEYRDFVMNRSNPESYTEAICSYEAVFTKYFSDLGHSWAVYSDTSEYEKVSFYPLMFKPEDMIERQDCPILKRRGFFTNYDDFLYNTGGEPTKIVYDRLMKTGEYDLDLIWDNLLRLENMSCLHRNMHLDYICDPGYAGTKPEGTDILCLAACPPEDIMFYKKVLADSKEAFSAIHIFGGKEEYEALLAVFDGSRNVRYEGEYISYAGFIKRSAELSGGSDLVLVLDLSAGNEKRHDRAVRNTDVVSHLLQNGKYISNTAYHFGYNKRLGLLVSPPSLGGSGFETVKSMWRGRFQDVSERMKKITPAVNFSFNDDPLFPDGGSFWIRSGILQKCADEIGKDEDKDLITLILSLLVQHFGSYTGRIFNIKKYPKALEEQLLILRENNRRLFRLYGSDIFYNIREKIKEGL